VSLNLQVASGVRNVAHDGAVRTPRLVARGLADLKAAHKGMLPVTLHVSEKANGIRQE
jgi:hypothetical protein